MSAFGFVRKLGHSQRFADSGKFLVPLDRKLSQLTKGRITLGGLGGIKQLLITTTGRKSGQPRSNPLLYVEHAGGYLVIGSNWGQGQHPAWSGNLLANPDAVITLRGKEIPVRGRLLDGAERDQAWAAARREWPAYDTYDERSGERSIRVFLLAPR
ncbi:nitroreductase family deazaflavin-dependent oxidoreductase [Pseudonocardiaceae bacterium YIM PH 21723]|nr:nitroreductase family deazaflavin-dependent oxidoreductase [Pseudonocardiaceae bacterium YIM PH 21723]